MLFKKKIVVKILNINMLTKNDKNNTIKKTYPHANGISLKKY